MMRWVVVWLCAVAGVVRGDEEYEFWEASAAGDVEAMSAILEVVPDLDLEYHDDDGRTPLLLAILGRHTAAARYLLCLLYTSPSPRDATLSRMPSSA